MNITTLEELQEKFNSVLSTITEKQSLINLELQEIDNYLNYTAPPRRHKMDFHIEPETDAIFKLQVDLNRRKLLKKAFNGFNVYGKYELPVNNRNTQGMIDLDNNVVKQASELAKYFKWLKELEVETSSKIRSKKSSLTHKQKMLALHYLGLDLSKFENTNSAKVLSKILDLDYDNTRKYLSYLAFGKNEVRTKNNFETLLKIFDIQGFEEITNTIKKDIKKL